MTTTTTTTDDDDKNQRQLMMMPMICWEWDLVNGGRMPHEAVEERVQQHLRPCPLPTLLPSPPALSTLKVHVEGLGFEVSG